MITLFMIVFGLMLIITGTRGTELLSWRGREEEGWLLIIGSVLGILALGLCAKDPTGLRLFFLGVSSGIATLLLIGSLGINRYSR